MKSAVYSSSMVVSCDLNSTRLAHCEFWFWNVFNVSIHVHRRTRFRFKAGQCSGMWLQNTRWALYKQLRCFKWTDAFCFSRMTPWRFVSFGTELVTVLWIGNWELWLTWTAGGFVKRTCSLLTAVWLCVICEPGSSVGIGTEYGMDGPGSNPVCSEFLTGKVVRGVNNIRVESERQCSE